MRCYCCTSQSLGNLFIQWTNVFLIFERAKGCELHDIYRQPESYASTLSDCLFHKTTNASLIALAALSSAEWFGFGLAASFLFSCTTPKL
jgi:hypothetical protein